MVLVPDGNMPRNCTLKSFRKKKTKNIQPAEEVQQGAWKLNGINTIRTAAFGQSPWSDFLGCSSTLWLPWYSHSICCAPDAEHQAPKGTRGPDTWPLTPLPPACTWTVLCIISPGGLVFRLFSRTSRKVTPPDAWIHNAYQCTVNR